MFYDFRGFFLKKNFILNLGLQQNKKKLWWVFLENSFHSS